MASYPCGCTYFTKIKGNTWVCMCDRTQNQGVGKQCSFCERGFHKLEKP